MKKYAFEILVALILCGSTIAAVASITLNASNVQVHSVGGAPVETCDKAAVVSALFDFQSSTIQYQLQFGTMSGSTFLPCSKTAPVTAVIDLTTGKWNTPDNALNGTLPIGALNAANNVTRTVRNGLENLSVNQNIVGGTQVSW